MSHRLPPDPDLEDLFDRDPSLERYANLLRTSRLKEPPLDPAFRSALRRQVMEEARRRSEVRPSFFASLFRGPGLAWAGATMAAVLLAIFVVQLTNQGSPLTQVTYLSSYPTGSVNAEQPITLTFTQAMDHQTVEQAIHIEPATEVKYHWQGNQLTIIPAASSLAPNTQYHVTIAPTATTAAGKPIEKPIAVTFNTQAAPSPAPTVTASPGPAVGLVGERLLQVAVATVVGWAPDGQAVFYIGRSGELGSISSDGRTPVILVRDGVRMAAVSPSGTQVAYSRGGSLDVIGNDGSGFQVLAQVEVTAICWSGTRVVYAVGPDPVSTVPSPATATPSPSSSPGLAPSPTPSPQPSPSATASPSAGPTPSPSVTPAPAASPLALTLPAQASNLSISPGGRRYIYTAAGTTVLADGSTTVTWPQPTGSQVSWSPDSGSVAFVADGALFSAAPDGSRRRPLATLAALGLGGPETPSITWSTTDFLLLGTSRSLAAVRADGGNAGAVRDLEYSHPLWAPTATRFAFLRSGNLWVADATGAGSGTAALAEAGRVVDAFMQARLAGDAARSTTFLDAAGRDAYSGSRPALIISTDPRPRRFYVVSAQLLPGSEGGVQYVVRLVLARDAIELFTYDEVLTLQRANGGPPLIHSVAAGARTPLGHGPSVLSAAVNGRSLVVTFDSDLAPESVSSAVTVTDPGGKAVAMKVEYSNRVVTVTLPVLPPVKGYRLTVATSIQDIDHQHLAVEFGFDFVAQSVVASATPQAP